MPTPNFKKCNCRQMNKNLNMNMFFTHKKGVFFRQVRGSLMYAMIGTRPNIAITLRISSEPRQLHWRAVK
jgi:hypothetical protein